MSTIQKEKFQIHNYDSSINAVIRRIQKETSPTNLTLILKYDKVMVRESLAKPTRKFTPLTSAGDYVENKKALKKIILDKIPNIEELRQKTLGKKIYLDICFYLNDQTTEEGNSQKDIGNLLKSVSDVLPQKFTDEKNELIDGLGLIDKKYDYMIFEIHAIKKFVQTHDDECYDIEISEIKEKSKFCFLCRR